MKISINGDEPISIADATKNFIGETYYGGGELEQLRHMVEQQTTVLAALVSALSEKQQKRFVEAMPFYRAALIAENSDG